MVDMGDDGNVSEVFDHGKVLAWGLLSRRRADAVVIGPVFLGGAKEMGPKPHQVNE